jgi:hypothetical protein
MQKLEAVEIARALMTQGQNWGVWHWLFEKPRVRQAADRATEALAAANEKVKSTWSDDLQIAYAEIVAEAALEANPRAKKQYEKARQAAENVDPAIKAAARRVKLADEEAARATDDAEELFAEAERRMSTVSTLPKPASQAGPEAKA